jgi:hypothetical protein
MWNLLINQMCKTYNLIIFMEIRNSLDLVSLNENFNSIPGFQSGSMNI